MEENGLQTQQIDQRPKVRVSGEAYKQLRGRTPVSLGSLRNEARGLKQHLHPEGDSSLPMLHNEEAHLAMSLVQPLRGHRVLQVELTFPRSPRMPSSAP
jgi:hypothetical protein